MLNIEQCHCQGKHTQHVLHDTVAEGAACVLLQHCRHVCLSCNTATCTYNKTGVWCCKQPARAGEGKGLTDPLWQPGAVRGVTGSPAAAAVRAL